jgi:Xaa-Pro aminopeptidase
VAATGSFAIDCQTAIAQDDDGAREVSMKKLVAAALALLAGLAPPTRGGEARERWERQCQIRRDKFDLVLPEAMRESGIDLWLVQVKEGHLEPLYDDLGRGYATGIGYYLFSDRGGERVERLALGIDGYLLEACGVYDAILGAFDLRKLVAERDPKRIGVNTSEQIGAADGLSHAGHRQLVQALGEPYAARLVSAEKLVSDFRSRRVASELVAFGEAAELSRVLAERALSNAVIAPGTTRLEDVAWWMQEELLRRGATSAFDMPSVYVTGPAGIEAVSTDRVIRPGDLLVIDWGVCRMNFCTDVKRIAYVLKPGESAPPAGIRNAFEKALAVREIIRRHLKPGPTAQAMLDHLNRKVEEAGFEVMQEFNKPRGGPKTEVIIGCHSVGNLGHDVGPSIAWFNPLQLTFPIRPGTLFSIEFFAYTAAPEWGGAKVRIPLEDDAVVTARGVEFPYPPNQRILLIR